MHHPLITFGGHNGDWNDKSYGNDLLGKRRKLIDLFIKYGVTLIFSGHDHYYQHNVFYYVDPVDGGERQIHFIVGGGGGTPLKTPPDQETIMQSIDEFDKQGMKVDTVKQARKHHYSIVTISDTLISGKVFEVSADSSMPAALIDEFSLPGD
jgi:3',5'-cyclic AMP phosphodiesterase CpdA